MNKEQRNYQFDFLRPQHSLFNYFTKLVEQYTKVRKIASGLLLNRNYSVGLFSLLAHLWSPKQVG